MTTLLRTEQLLVSRQDPRTRAFTRVGTLTFDGARYTFHYDAEATRPLPGLPLGGHHQSETLFPIFAERVMDPRRPERPTTLERLGLPPDAGPFEVLAVTGGGRTGDTYELTPLPQEGPINLPFLVHGVRHLNTREQAAVASLRPGDQLSLVHESDNAINGRALLVTQDRVRLGYVPDPLLDYVHAIVRSAHTLRVERLNSVECGLHMRLLVRLSGRYER
jgi:hypothetical protein